MTWAVDFYIRYITSSFRLSFYISAGIRDQWTLERFTCQNQALSSFPCWTVHLSGVCPDDESEAPRPELMFLLSGNLVVCPQSQMLLLLSFRGFGTGVSPSQSPCVKHENEKTYNSVNENRGTGVDSVDVAEQERPFKPYTCLQCNKSCCSKSLDLSFFVFSIGHGLGCWMFRFFCFDNSRCPTRKQNLALGAHCFPFHGDLVRISPWRMIFLRGLGSSRSASRCSCY